MAFLLTYRAVLGALVTGLAVAAPVQGAEPSFQLFFEVCLRTGGLVDRVARHMDRLESWQKIPPEEHVVLKGIDNNRTWYLHDDMVQGIVVAGNLSFQDHADPSVCMVAVPRGDRTINDALQFLYDSGGQDAVPPYPGNADDVFAALDLEGNWVVVGVHQIPAGTHLQFLLYDLPDAEVKASIRAVD